MRKNNGKMAASLQCCQHYNAKFPRDDHLPFEHFERRITTIFISKMGIKFNLILAKSENNGIGYKGGLPWSLR